MKIKAKKKIYVFGNNLFITSHYGPLVPQTPTKSCPYWTNLLVPL